MTSFVGVTSFAAEPTPWQIDFQPAATPVMEQIRDFHQLLFIIILLISIFVLGLLLYTMVKFRAKNNPIPSMTTHNTVIEVLWTVVPVIILVVIECDQRP